MTDWLKKKIKEWSSVMSTKPEVERKSEDFFGEYYYLGTPFSIKIYKIDNGKGFWNYNRIEVLRDSVQIGSYIRNYSSYGIRTFHPFSFKGEWYALYSEKYTATRVAKLTDKFEDWCGEIANSSGFCPTEYFIPIKMSEMVSYQDPQGQEKKYESSIYFDQEYKDEEEFWKEVNDRPNGITSWLPWGIMSGCVWGDDSSWKIKYIDLSQIDQKILKITEKFGYCEMPNNLSLRQAIGITGDHYVKITSFTHYDLRKETEDEKE